MRRLLTKVAEFLFTISPAVPIDLRKAFVGSSEGRIARYAALFGLFFCFIFTAGLCAVEGTLYGSDPRRLYLVQDWWNIALYLSVCPAYIALSSWMVVLTFRHWTSLSEFSISLGGDRTSPKPEKRLGLALFSILFAIAFLITNYMGDIMDPRRVQPFYWFMSDVGGGFRILNRVGYYYVALNFGLLFMTASAIFCFFALSLEVMKAGEALSLGNLTDFRRLRGSLEAFTTAYLLAKALAACYMLNAYIWKDSPLGKTSNLQIAGVLLTAIGVFFVSVPRLHVELRWYQYSSAKAVGLPSEEDDDEYRDIRPRTVKLWAHVLDVLLIGSFVGTFWQIDLTPTVLFEWLRQ